METIKPSINFSGKYSKRDRWDANLKWVELDNEWRVFRFVYLADKPGFISRVPIHWLSTKSQKRFPLFCNNWNPLKEEWGRKGCIVCRDFNWNEPTAKENIKQLKPKFMYYTYAINRDKQEAGNVRNDKNWTPFDPIRFPGMVANALDKASERNFEYVEIDGEKKKKIFSFVEVEKGSDMCIRYDAAAKAVTDKYAVQFVKQTPLTQEELFFASKLKPIYEMIEYTSEEEQYDSLKKNEYYDMIATVSTANQQAGVTEEDKDITVKPTTSFSGAQVDYDDIDVTPDGKVITVKNPPAPIQVQAPQPEAPQANTVAQALNTTFEQSAELQPKEVVVEKDSTDTFIAKHNLGSKSVNNATVPNCFGEYQAKTICRNECPVKKDCLAAESNMS